MKRFTRRNILGAAGAFAGGSALAVAAGAAIGATAALPAAKATIVADPILALDTERRRLDELHTEANDAIEARSETLPPDQWKDDAQLVALDRRGEDLERRIMALEDQIFAAVPVSAAGAIVQLRLVWWAADLEGSDQHTQAINNVISWLEGDTA